MTRDDARLDELEDRWLAAADLGRWLSAADLWRIAPN